MLTTDPASLAQYIIAAIALSILIAGAVATIQAALRQK